MQFPRFTVIFSALFEYLICVNMNPGHVAEGRHMNIFKNGAGCLDYINIAIKHSYAGATMGLKSTAAKAVSQQILDILM